MATRTTVLLALTLFCCSFFNVATAVAKISCNRALTNAQLPNYTKCKYLIVGGGPGGLYSAYQLKALGKDVCVVEKEAIFGGKMQDVPGPPTNDGKPPKEFGTCGLRINESQKEMRCLAYELNVTLQESPFETVTYTRGAWKRDSSEFITAGHFNLSFAAPAGYGPEIDLYAYAMLGLYPVNPLTGETPAVSPLESCAEHPNVISYLRDVLGPEASEFLQATNNFRGDFTIPKDVCNYIALAQVEATRCCTTFYLAGGFEGYWNATRERAAQAGVRFFKNAEVQCVLKHNNSITPLKYQVVTKNGKGFLAERVIMAMPADAVQKVSGNIADEINKNKHIQSVQPEETVYYNAWYPRRFWEEANGNGINPTQPGYSWRVISDGQCTVRSEYPRFSYLYDTNVSRPVYVDEPECMDEWKSAYETGGIARVTELVENSLEQQFPGVAIPKPTVAYFFNKKSSWAHIKPYSRRDYNITPESMSEWAAHPLPGEKVCVVGENYQVAYTAWAHGAVRSSINCLKQHFTDVLPLADIVYHETCGNRTEWPNEERLPGSKPARRIMLGGKWIYPRELWKR